MVIIAFEPIINSGLNMDKLQSKLNNFVKVRTIPAVLNALLQELEDGFDRVAHDEGQK